jgi:integrase
VLHSICLAANLCIDNTGSKITLPVVITDDGLLQSFLDYLIVHRNRSRSWIDRSVFSVRLLIDYTIQNESAFDNKFDLFREFANSLYTGTIHENGEDPSWLRWKPRREDDAAFLIGLITKYSDWLAEQNENKNLQINPAIKPSSYEQWLSLAAYLHKKKRAFLSHLWSNKPSSESSRYVKPRISQVLDGASETKAFPEEKIDELLWYGFVRYGYETIDLIHQRLDLKHVLITMLMHYGGLRLSECLQLWVEDIIPWDDMSAVVKVFHPALGIDSSNKRSRREILNSRYGLKPRFEYPKSHSLHAGWKSPLLNSQTHYYFVVYWFPNSIGKTFNDLWRLYLTHQRTSDEGRHPFAFTTRTGAPLSIKGYNQSLKRAVERIGLPFSKEAATTAHAHRHSYGQALAASGVDSLVIRSAMHHKSIESQGVYTQLTEKQVKEHLKNIDIQLRMSIDKMLRINES